MARFICHLDMDAFFAAIEQRDHPEFKGKPVVIGADPKGGRGRGVVSTCSYEARKYGVRSAMPISTAYRKCPQGIFLPPDMEKYLGVSDQMFKILNEFTPDIEPVSCDEAFLDITATAHLFGGIMPMAQKIKQRINQELKLNCSVGIAKNKMIAKIASDYCKPDGLLIVEPEKSLKFLWPLPIERMWGVGGRTKELLNAQGIFTIEDLARTPSVRIRKWLGEHGAQLHQLANGEDFRIVCSDGSVKSVSNEHTFEEDEGSQEAVCQSISFLSEKVSFRLRRQELKGKTITVKIRTSNFKTVTRSCTIEHRTNFFDDIFRVSRELFDGFYQPFMKIRLIGVRVSNFEDPYVREDLFENPQEIRREKIHRAVDVIKEKFGQHAIARGK